jgi:hypothetical protein
MRLIDILNKIANGELKEGTKVIWKVKECWGDIEYTYKDGDLEREVCGEKIYVYEEMFSRHLKDEVELIEPQEPKECEHEWSKYSIGRLGRTENYRRCKKCGIHEEDIGPTDNTKIEEVVVDETDINCLGIHSKTTLLNIINKLNEVINKVNIHSTVLLAQEKDIKEIQEELDY